MRLLSLLAVLLGISNATRAQNFQISSATGAPNAAAPLSISFTGTNTRAVDLTVVFDDSKLALPVANGNIPGAGLNGATCARQGSNRILIFALNLPVSGTTQLCQLPFTILSSARPGSARVEGTEAGCYLQNGTSHPDCSVANGAVSVSGNAAPPLPALPPSPYKYLYFLLSAAPGAPTVSQLSNFDFSSGGIRPLLGLNVESPLVAFGMLPFRATGDFAALLLANPNSPRAKLERYVQVQYRANANLALAKTALQNDPFVIAVFDANPELRVGTSASNPASVPAAPAASPKTVQTQYHLAF